MPTPRSPPPLPPCPVGLPGGSGVSPVVSGRVTLDSHPHTSVLALDAPRTRCPAPYKCQSGLTRVPAIAPWPVTLLHSWGNCGQAHRAQSAPSQRPYRTHLCPPKCPCPRTELHCPGLQWGFQRRWSGHSWGPLVQAALAPPMADPTPLLRWTSRTSGFGHRPLNKGKHPLRNWPGLQSVSTSRMVLAAQGDFC